LFKDKVNISRYHVRFHVGFFEGVPPLWHHHVSLRDMADDLTPKEEESGAMGAWTLPMFTFALLLKSN